MNSDSEWKTLIENIRATYREIRLICPVNIALLPSHSRPMYADRRDKAFEELIEMMEELRRSRDPNWLGAEHNRTESDPVPDLPFSKDVAVETTPAPATESRVTTDEPLIKTTGREQRVIYLD